MALFKSELDKMYNGSDADPREREEEMNLMRETTYNETDTNQDGLIRSVTGTAAADSNSDTVGVHCTSAHARARLEDAAHDCASLVTHSHLPLASTTVQVC